MSLRLRLVSYNIRKAVGLDWRRRPERILQVLDEVGADVAVLQEADKRLAPRPAALPHHLIESHGGWVHVDPGPGPSLGWHGNAVLLKPTLKGTVEERLALPGIEPRGALMVRVEGVGGAFLLCAAHLGLNLGSRHRQMAAIAGATAGVTLPVVIAGDLNERRPERLLDSMPRASVVTPGASFHASRPVVALDHVVLCGRVRAVGSGVHRSAESRVASDHLPVWADLVVG